MADVETPIIIYDFGGGVRNGNLKLNLLFVVKKNAKGRKKENGRSGKKYSE
ncbi:MAG: hypothetical protein NTZ39_11850 [Methanoregula sp.]|nr:hypothetical protein [Methanoregula sp.]